MATCHSPPPYLAFRTRSLILPHLTSHINKINNKSHPSLTPCRRGKHPRKGKTQKAHSALPSIPSSIGTSYSHLLSTWPHWHWHWQIHRLISSPSPSHSLTLNPPPPKSPLLSSLNYHRIPSQRIHLPISFPPSPHPIPTSKLRKLPK